MFVLQENIYIYTQFCCLSRIPLHRHTDVYIEREQDRETHALVTTLWKQTQELTPLLNK